MSENTASIEKPMSKEEIEEKLNKTEVQCNMYQAAMINKLLAGTPYRLDVFENCKKLINSSSKANKKKQNASGRQHEYPGNMGGNLSDSGHNTPGSYSSLQDGDNGHSDHDNSHSRRTSRRERKPATKPDLGYEEPKPIKGVKLSGASREIFRKSEEILISLREDFLRVPEFSSKASKFDQEIKKLRDGHYKTTDLLGNAVRKYLNSMFSVASTNPNISTKLASFSNKFEESFASLDNKTLFEESKMEPFLARKKSGSFGGKKKLSKQGSKSNLDMDRPMSDEEKKALSKNIRNLTAQQLRGIIKIVRDMFPEKDGMLEFDIDHLPPRK